MSIFEPAFPVDVFSFRVPKPRKSVMYAFLHEGTWYYSREPVMRVAERHKFSLAIDHPLVMRPATIKTYDVPARGWAYESDVLAAFPGPFTGFVIGRSKAPSFSPNLVYSLFYWGA